MSNFKDLAECDNCDWKGRSEECEDIRDFWSRVEPGDIMPAGDCPECGAFCFLVRNVKHETGSV